MRDYFQVESFEEGDHITSYIESVNNPYNHRLSELGSSLMLQVRTHGLILSPGLQVFLGGQNAADDPPPSPDDADRALLPDRYLTSPPLRR